MNIQKHIEAERIDGVRVRQGKGNRNYWGRCLKRLPSFFVMLPVYYPFLYLKYLWASQLLLFEK